MASPAGGQAAGSRRQGVVAASAGAVVRLERQGRRKGEPTETNTIRHDNVEYVVTSLGAEDYKEYYNGFANRVLWPVLH